ncbi:hypothetical protein HZB04_01845 [Candidatus Wolfebacteria bacterium]|nr:hypothetical protein [Candidatus Wolfebacteria bacterium]
MLNKLNIKILFAVFALLLFVLNFGLVLANDANIGCGDAIGKYKYPWCNDPPTGIADLVSKFYNYALAAVGVAALGVIIYGGILWITSAGNPGKISEAKEWITGAIFGVVLLISAVLLFNTINPEIASLKEPVIKTVTVKSDCSELSDADKCIANLQCQLTRGKCEKKGSTIAIGTVKEGGVCKDVNCESGLTCIGSVCKKLESSSQSGSNIDCSKIYPGSCDNHPSNKCQLIISSGGTKCSNK